MISKINIKKNKQLVKLLCSGNNIRKIDVRKVRQGFILIYDKKVKVRKDGKWKKQGNSKKTRTILKVK
jgi:hypothetical protein